MKVHVILEDGKKIYESESKKERDGLFKEMKKDDRNVEKKEFKYIKD